MSSSQAQHKSYRGLLLRNEAVQLTVDRYTVVVMHSGVKAGTGIYLQYDSAAEAEEKARRINAYLNRATGEDDYNLRVTVVGQLGEVELAESQMQYNKYPIVAGGGAEQKARGQQLQALAAEAATESGLILTDEGKVVEDDGTETKWQRKSTSQHYDQGK